RVPEGEGQRGDLVRRREIDLARFFIDRDGPDLYVSWRRNRLVGAGLAAVSAFFIGLIVVVAALLRGQVAARGGWDALPVESWLILALPAIPALLAAYPAAALLWNRSEIAVHDGSLHAWHGPVPTFPVGTRRVPLSDVTELEVTMRVHRRENSTTYSYDLQAVREDGRPVRLIVGESSDAVPRAIKRLLEAHLAETTAGRIPAAPAEAVEERDEPRSPAGALTLICPRCGGTLVPPPERAEIRCSHCTARVPVPRSVRRALRLRPARRRDKARFRATFDAQKEGDRLIFHAAWPPPIGRALLGLAGGIGGLVLILWFFGLYSPAVLAGGFPASILLALLPIGGLWAGYVGLCYLVNRTTTRVDETRVRVSDGPLPWRPTRTLDTTAITQFVVREEPRNPLRPGEPYFELQALSHHGAALTVFGEIADREALETLESLIENRLGLVDQAVRN
ncbi:MAG: hypothetical protein AAF907_09230, partial [Planctomycetota bacterium]